MCEGLRALLEDERNDGRQEGICLGENNKLKQQVEKKVKKGYSVEQIADMLEEPVEVISEMIKAIEHQF